MSSRFVHLPEGRFFVFLNSMIKVFSYYRSNLNRETRLVYRILSAFTSVGDLSKICSQVWIQA